MLATQRSQTRGLRSGGDGSSSSCIACVSERSRAKPIAAPAAQPTASPKNAARRLMWDVSAGRTPAAIAPPSGTAVWRMPSASPRSSGPNHAITARPLADCVPPPSAPATARAATSPPNDDVKPAATSATAHPASPDVSTARSPIRSATMPHGSSVSSSPKLSAASTTPTCVSVRSYPCRICGAIDGRPRRIAEKLAWPTTPAARIAQRYLLRPARVEVTQLLDLLCVRPVAVPARHFQVDGELLQPRVRDERAEPLADQPVADVVVSVAVRAEWRPRVVRVERAQPVEADACIDVVEERIERRAIRDVDARRVQMAGVEADP